MSSLTAKASTALFYGARSFRLVSQPAPPSAPGRRVSWALRHTHAPTLSTYSTLASPPAAAVASLGPAVAEPPAGVGVGAAAKGAPGPAELPAFPFARPSNGHPPEDYASLRRECPVSKAKLWCAGGRARACIWAPRAPAGDDNAPSRVHL